MAHHHQARTTKRIAGVQNQLVTSRRFRHGAGLSQRARGLQKNQKYPFAPPEDWYEPKNEHDASSANFKIIVQSPGPGYKHPVTADEIRRRLSQLPVEMLEPLEIVQLSRMTRKKKSLPCYGMQWGASLYLYPIEEEMVEYFARPPKPAQIMEAKMYGGRWLQTPPNDWKLIWTEASIKDFYLNNILIHELGHLLDQRNSSYADRERFAEWFAIEHGYRKIGKGDFKKKKIVRRHHSK